MAEMKEEKITIAETMTHTQKIRSVELVG